MKGHHVINGARSHNFGTKAFLFESNIWKNFTLRHFVAQNCSSINTQHFESSTVRDTRLGGKYCRVFGLSLGNSNYIFNYTDFWHDWEVRCKHD